MKKSFLFILTFYLTINQSFHARSPDKLESGQQPADNITEFYVDEPVFNGRVRIVEAGSKKNATVVLIHGLGDEAAHNWDNLIPVLEPNYHIIAFDLPGFGKSSKGNHLYSPGNYAKFVKWVVDNYADDSVILLGHSMGGGIALRFAADYPDSLSRLILVDVAGILHRSVMARYMTRISPKEGWQELFSSSVTLLNNFIGKTIDKLEPDGLPVDLNLILESKLLRKIVLKGNPASIAGLALIQEDFNSALDSVKTPTNIIWGENDQIAPLRTGKILADRLTFSQLDIIGGAGHVLIINKHELFNRILLDVLSHPPLPPPKSEIKTKSDLPGPGQRNGWCDDGTGTEFSGAYKRIEIRNCRDVRLNNVTAGQVHITNSDVIIENSLIKSGGTALQVENSKITATVLTVNGKVAIDASASILDLAGTTLKADEYAIKAAKKSSFLFSVSRIFSNRSNGYIHNRLVVSQDTL